MCPPQCYELTPPNGVLGENSLPSSLGERILWSPRPLGELQKVGDRAE